MGDLNQTDMFGGRYDLSTEEAINKRKEEIVSRAVEQTEQYKSERAADASRWEARDAAYMPLAEKYRDGTATITASMTDSERASILKDKFITAADYRGQSNDRIANERENLDSGKVGLVKKALTRAAQEFGLPKSLVNDDTNMTVVVSIGSLKESAGKQIDNAEQLIKLLPVLDEAVAGAIGIEAHDNRYYADYNTALFANLLGGYSEGSMFVPVRFGVKVDNLGKATLYVVISDQQINKAEVVKSPTPGKPGENDSRSASGINIPQLAGKINTPDIVKYLPDEFLSNSQKKIKNKAIAETVKYTNDKNDRKYVEYIQNGDLRSVKRMVAEAAKASGYNIRAWHGTTAFFTVFRKGDIGYHVGSMEQAEDRVRGLESARIMPLFVKANNLLEIGMDYGNWGGSNVALMLLETEVFEDYPKVEEKLRKILKIDRAKGIETTSQRQDRAARELLQSLGYDGIVYENAFEGRSKLHSGDNKSYILFDPSQLKSADPVTYDSDGNIIPLSERFNGENEDIRWELRAFSDGKRFVDVEADQEQFDGLSMREMGRLAKRIIKQKFAGKVIGIDNRFFVNGNTASEYGFPANQLDVKEHEAKMRASTELDNLLDAGTNFRTEPDGKDGHTHPKMVDDFRYFDTIFKVGNEYYSGTINIMPLKKGLLLKDITKIENITEDIRSSYGLNPKSTFLRDASMNNISQPTPSVNPVSQEISSAGTSIKQIPALFNNKNVSFGKTNVDIGGGKYDLATNFLAERGTKNYLFDPYNQSREVNKATLDFLMSGNKADTDASRWEARDAAYMPLAEKYRDGTASAEDIKALNKQVEEAAREAGYSDKMYHGSKKGGGFTVFKGWQYFTPKEEYARRYAQRDNPNSMYSVFVKAENYFDTRKAEAKSLFKKYRLEYGLGKLQENGLPDWTDGYDLAEIIEDNGLKYDGIILDEGGDVVNGEPVSRGLSYVIRDSAQIKSADPVTYDSDGNIIPLSERFNGENEDIRWEKRGNYDYSSKSFGDQVEDVVNGVFPKNDTLIMGGTPKVFQDIGLLPLPMTYTQKHVKEAIANADGDHLGKDLLKQVPDALNDPIAIIDSASNPGRLVAIIELNNHSRNVIAAVEIDGEGQMHGNRIDSNAVVTVHSRDNAINGLLKDAIISETQGNGGVYYWQKNKATQLANGRGVQFPKRLAIADGFIRSIRDSKSKVNPKINSIVETKQFKRWFGNSKIVNDDNTPKVVYHGTDSEFDAFDPSKGRANMDIQGMFFSPWELDAEGYGPNVGSYYLSIQNPAPEGVAYKALNRFKGQNNAGVKARQYLESLGYDGVNNNDEEYIAFYPSQIKSATDNIGTFDKESDKYRFESRDYSLDFNTPQLDTKALAEAVKAGEGTVEDRFNVSFDYDGRDYTVAVKDAQGNKTYVREGRAGEEDDVKAAAKRTAAAFIRNIKRGKADSRSASTAGIYIKKGKNTNPRYKRAPPRRESQTINSQILFIRFSALNAFLYIFRLTNDSSVIKCRYGYEDNK